MLRGILTAVLVALPTLAAAQAPKIILNDASLDEYIIEFETPTVLDYTFHGSKTPGTTLDVAQDEKGKLIGRMHTSGVTISGDGTIKGKVKTVDALPYVTTTTVEKGVIDGDATYAVAKLRASLWGWGSESMLVGEMFMKYCMTIEDPIAQRKRRICAPYWHQIEEKVPHIGTWQVMLASLSLYGSTEIEGLGWIVTSSKRDETARLYEAAVYGKISTKTGLAKVVVQPSKLPDAPPSPGTVTLIGKVKVEAKGLVHFTAIHEVKGKLLGQSFDEVFDSNDEGMN